MHDNDSLHELILSLSQSEKRYFKIHASTSSNRKDSKYVEMFDILSKQKHYDDEALIKKMKPSSFTKNLSQNKKYLKDSIIKSLTEKQEKSPKDIVNELIKEYEVLQKKMLYKEMFKKLQKAKAVAEKYELFQLNLNILQIEMKSLLRNNFNKVSLLMEEWLAVREDLIIKNNLLNNIDNVVYKVYAIKLMYYKKISSEKLVEIENDINQFNKEEIKKIDSFKIKKRYLELLDFYTTLKNDFEKNVEINRTIFELFSNKNEHFKHIRFIYVFSYNNYVSSIFRAGKFDLLFEVLNLGYTIVLKNDYIKLDFFTKMTSNWLAYYLNTGKIDEAHLLEKKFEEEYKKNSSKIDKVDLISIFYNFSLIYFFNEKFDKCLFWLKRLEDLKQNQRTDLYVDAYIISVICHFELANISVLESLIRSKRSRGGIEEIEKVILNAILKISKNDLTKKQTFEVLKIKLDKLKQNHLSVDWITLNIWLDSKLGDQSIQELYRKEVL